ncbi:MAG: helix-turn-helix transcriptional regulator [Lentisphaeria bacterium]|nr:helix-turn-helix transcriptional regulator [Lentisphaeria bacterium]
MNIRKNHYVKPDPERNDFLSSFRIRPILAGFAEDITEWPRNPDFLNDFFFRLYLPVTGAFRIRTAAEEMEIVPGALYLIPAFVPCKFSGVAPSTHDYIHFSSPQLRTVPALSFLRKHIPGDITAVRTRFAAVREELASGSLQGLVEARHHIELLLLPFLEEGAGTGARIGLRFAELLNYIELHLDEPLHSPELAARMGMSRAEFSAEFRRCFGITPKQYLVRSRLALARRLLVESSMQIKEIALRCGYDDPFFFSRQFRRYTGLSPVVFRRTGR